MPCSAEQRFVRKGGSGGYKCEYTSNEEYSVPLVTVGATVFDGSTLDDLRVLNPDAAAPFIDELNRFEGEMTKVLANIGKRQQIDDAFKELQAAENVRDESPSAYQMARTAYYTLLNGTEWLAEERERIASAEVDPEIRRYRDAVASIDLRKNEQQKTIDVVNGIKDKVLSLRDDFQYSVNTFSDQIEKVKIQLAMENRSREKERDNTWVWVDVILNVLLVAVLLYAVYSFVRRYFLTWQRSNAVRVPTYTGTIV
jgi:hypothetical protein